MNDKKNGKGVYEWISLEQTYIGQFANDLRHGYGRMDLKDGTKLEGLWQNGMLKNGNGTLI